MKNIYQLALRCQSISDVKMETDRNLIPYGKILFTDYTVKGPIDDYLSAIDELRMALNDKYPAIGYELKQHSYNYRSDKIIHYTALKTIVDCVRWIRGRFFDPHPRSAEAIGGLAAYRGGQARCNYAEAFEVVMRRI